ncbi:uncharacterized protein LOC143058333 [Mytilus galloprovincialis]|uniref:uncharacterized protein LOC143058333 n=1 Tax=Mytilus galloprovincialis TaxID=29158 RepID=UPI003F7BD2C8
MYFSAGFMTAALIFAIGCFVSKCKTSRRKDDDAENAELIDDEDKVFVSAHKNEYVNEGSFESDQKSYAYCHIDTDQKSSDDFSQSSTSKKRYNRESYDLVDHNRIKSSLLNKKENPNPYNHVTIDMEVTEYGNASFLKPRIEIMDPTYSHLSEMKLQDEKTKKDDKGKIEHKSTDEKNNSSNKENKKQKTTEKEKQKKTEKKKEKKPKKVFENQKQKKFENETQKQKKPETEKQKKKQNNPEKDQGKQINQQKETYKPKTLENEALKQKETEPKEKMKIKKEQRTDIIQTTMEKGEYKVINNCENDEKTVENDNEKENPSEDNKLNRHKFGYSLVQKQRSIPNEKTAHIIEGSHTFEILCDQDDSSYQLTSSSEESNETSEVSTESNSRESSVPGVSDETSGSGSETETDKLLPSAMAINILYEDVSVSKGNVLIGAIVETSESEFELQEKDGNN